MSHIDPDLLDLIGPLSGDVAMVGGAFEGAARTDRALSLWNPPLRSADADLLPDKPLADARARDMTRNDAYVGAGATIHKDTIVGSMYVLSAKPETKVLGLDEKWAEEFSEEVETKFTLAAESPMNYFDASRMNNFTEQVRLALGVYLASGEMLATVEWMRDTSLPFRTAIQMVDLDRLSNPPGSLESTRLRAGIQRNRYGAPEGYHIRMGHPTDYINPDSYKWKYVPAKKPWGRPQVIHIFEQMRVDQTRGISEMVSALSEMQITKKFRRITLQNAVVNASYAAAIESDLPPEAAYAAIGGGNVNAIEQYGSAYLGAIAEYAGSARNMHIDGVKIPHLYPGTKLKLLNAGTPGGVGTGFEQSLLRYIAANLGVSYEQLSKDYSQTNYSSAKAALNETSKHLKARKRFVADRFASIIYRLWLEEVINSGEITSMPRSAPSIYDGLNLDAYAAAEWIGASFGQIDELKETQAAVLRLKANLSTHEDELAKQGRDWRKVFRQREREMREMESRKIIMQEDNSVNAASGSPREKSEPKAEAQETTAALAAMAESINALARTPATAPVTVNNVRMDELQEIVGALTDVGRGMNEVATKMARKTRTRVLKHDDKGRILETENSPVEDGE